MRLCTQMGYAGDIAAALEQVVALDRAGVDIVWVPEAYGFDAVSLMGYLAARTERIQIGSGILPIYSRTPALLAQTAAGLDWVSGGRAVLGIGASGPQVIEGWHGVPYDRPVQRTTEVIEICRRVWRREVLTNEGAYTIPLPPEQGTGLGKPLKIITRPLRADIPIYVAALGPKNVEAVAAVADGWLPIFYVPERADAVWGASLRAGAARRDPSLAPLEVAAGGPLAIGDGLEHLREGGRAGAALYIGGMGAKGKNFYNDLARRYGYEREAEGIQDLYLAGEKERAAALVPDELLERTSLIGPAGYVRERIEAFRDSGVTVLSVQPIGPDPLGSLRQVREWLS